MSENCYSGIQSHEYDDAYGDYLDYLEKLERLEAEEEPDEEEIARIKKIIEMRLNLLMNTNA